MAQTIKLKRSASAGAAPTVSQLELGEVAINTYDGKMYIKKSVGGTESIVEISGGGGASAADAILVEYLYTATASQTAFSGNDDNSAFLSYEVGTIQVFLNGILLDPDTDYTATNGALITLTSGAALDDYLQIFAFKKKISDGSVTVNNFSGNNSTTSYTLSLDPGDENNTRVFIDGVYQSKANYSVSGTTITFSSAPPSGTGIEVEIGNRVVSLDTASSLDFPDNVKLRLGTSQDLEIYHDASDSLINDSGTGSLKLQTGGSTKLEVTSTGVDVTGNIAVSGTVDGVDIAARDAVLTSTTTTAGAALPKAGGAMTGAITTNSTFDGRDVATDGSKLDGIEAGATADQTQSEINALGITATGLSGTPAISVANITTTGELRGPASLVIDPAGIGDNTGTVVIKGNLQVDGATTTINSTTLTVDDLNLTLASGAANGTAADGAGITIDGASATLTYQSTGDNWAFNKPLNVQTNLLLSSDGSNGIISESGAGSLFLRGSGVSIQNASNANMIQALSAGAVTLYHNGAPKIATSSSGASITGIVNVTGNIVVSGTVDGVDIAARDAILTSTTTTAGAALPKAGGTMTGDLILGDSIKLELGAGTGGDLQLYHDGSHSYVTNTYASGALKLVSDDFRIENASNRNQLKTGVSGAVQLFFDDGSATGLRLGTTATGVDVTGTVTADGLTVQTTGSTTALLTLNNADGNGTLSQINLGYTADPDHGNISYTGDMIFTAGAAERMRIDSSGFVGINTAGAVSYTPLTLETASGSAFTAGGVNGVGLILRNRSSTVGTSSGIKWAANTSYHDLGGIHMVLTGNSSTNETADLTFFTSNSGDSGNTEKMRIDSAGKIKIGNNIPMWSGSYGGALFLKGNNATSDRYAQLTIVDSTGAAAYTGLVVNTVGNVGIGTSSPLTLDGNAAPGLTIKSNGPYILLQDANNSDKVTYMSNNTGVLQFGIVGDNGISGKTEHMRIDTSGNATFAGRIGAGAGTASLPSLSFAGDSNTGLYSPSADNLGFAIGGTARAFMSNSQFNVNAKIVATELDINGTGDVSGNLTAGALFSNAGLRNAGGSDFGSQQTLWATANGSTHQAGYTIGWNTGGNNARTQKMHLDNNGNLSVTGTVSIKANSLTIDSDYGHSSGRHQTLVCHNAITANQAWTDVAFVSYSPSLTIQGTAQRDNNGSMGMSSYFGTIFGGYGNVNVVAERSTASPMNSGGFGALEYRYLNGTAPSGAYRLQVRMPITAGTMYITTTLNGQAFSQITED